MLKKKGDSGPQSGSGAAALVAVIALILVLYILFLPPETRKSILEGDDNEISPGSDIYNLTLLSESPGRLDMLAFDQYEHDISPIYLLRSTESKVLKNWNVFHVKNGVFDKQSYSTTFRIADPDNTNNLLLAFIAKEREGRLTIYLNGKDIFSDTITSYNPNPIKLPDTLLRENNEIVLEVSGVGWAFWNTNEYVIDDMKVLAQITDTSRQESRNVFVIRDMEYFNLDKAYLKFNPECVPNQVGVLEISLNNRVLFSGIPDCGILNTKEFSVGLLNKGENKLIFKTLKGSYLIDNILVKTSLKEMNYPLYHFEINASLFEKIRSDEADIKFKAEFFNDPSRKQGVVHINGRAFTFSTKEKSWEKTISDYVEQEDNWLKIIPDGSALDLLKISVYVG